MIIMDLNEFVRNILKESMKDVIQGIICWVSDTFQDIKSWVKDKIQDIQSLVDDIYRSMKYKGKDTIRYTNSWTARLAHYTCLLSE
jgi:hypothetical protein